MSRIAAALLMAGLGLAALAPGGADAQLRDPPLGWDMWDPGWTRRDSWQQERMDDDLRLRMTRHETFLRDGVPTPYRGARNPLSRTPANVDLGRTLYTANCAGCHDPAGTGGGGAGSALYPSPALLAHLLRMPRTVDEYLLWTIAEGGAPIGTAMPAFKDTLSENQVWQIITFMRAGFPPNDTP